MEFRLPMKAAEQSPDWHLSSAHASRPGAILLGMDTEGGKRASKRDDKRMQRLEDGCPVKEQLHRFVPSKTGDDCILGEHLDLRREVTCARTIDPIIDRADAKPPFQNPTR